MLMHFAVGRSWVLLAAATLAATALGDWLAPSRACASCGDYLTILPGDGPSMVGHGVLTSKTQWLGTHGQGSLAISRESASQAEAIAASVRALPKPLPCQRCPFAPEGNVPCEGPWCSANQVPTTAPTIVLEHIQKNLACWRTAFVNDQRASASHLHVFDTQAPVHRCDPIFHPPRVS